MGGQITVHSEEGKGSTFEFSVVCGLQDAKMRDISQPVHGLADKRVLVWMIMILLATFSTLY